MQLKKVSPHIWRVQLWRLTSVNVWLIEEEDGVAIVDAGFSFMARDVLRAADSIGAGPVRRLLLTHGHPDHAGGAALIARVRSVPVLAHRLELPYLTGKRRYPRVPLPRPRLGRVVTALPEDSKGRLAPTGDLTPWAAPGHTPGHVVYYHETDRVLLAGDLFNAKNGRLRRLGHWYSVDRLEAIRSERLLSRLRPSRVETSHGGGVPNPPSRL